MDRRYQRLWAAAAGALAFHALVLLALTLLPRAKEVAPRPPAVLRVELRKVPDARPPASGDKEAPKATASRKATPPAGRRREGRNRARAVVARLERRRGH